MDACVTGAAKPTSKPQRRVPRRTLVLSSLYGGRVLKMAAYPAEDWAMNRWPAGCTASDVQLYASMNTWFDILAPWWCIARAGEHASPRPSRDAQAYRVQVPHYDATVDVAAACGHGGADKQLAAR